MSATALRLRPGLTPDSSGSQSIEDLPEVGRATKGIARTTGAVALPRHTI